MKENNKKLTSARDNYGDYIEKVAETTTLPN